MLYINKSYYPRDNSYSVCLSSKFINPRISPCVNNKGAKTELITISEPFMLVPKGRSRGLPMILVKDNEEMVYSVIFEEKFLEPYTLDEDRLMSETIRDFKEYQDSDLYYNMGNLLF